MFRKFISSLLIIALVNVLGIASAYAGVNPEKEGRLSAKVKENIKKLGTGESAKIKITLKDKTKLQGYVSQINEDSFRVTDSKTGRQAEVQYSQVKKVKGNNLSTGGKIAIGVGIVVAILAVVVLANKKTECSICPE